MTPDIAAELEASKDATVPSHHSSIKLITQSLDALNACLQRAPDFLTTLPQLPRIALEQATPSGGKFWLGVAMDSGVSLCWGKLGSRGSRKHIPIEQCLHKNPVLELKGRVLDKLNNGYDLIPHETTLP